MAIDDRSALPRLNEPFGVPTTYCDSLAKIERHGPCCHLIFAVRQSSIYDDTPERIVTARLIIPAEFLPEIGLLLMRGQSGVTTSAPENVEALH